MSTSGAPAPPAPLLPYQDAEASVVPRAILGLNAFSPQVVPGQHSDVPSAPLREILELEELLPPPELPQIPRYYITCYYYGCRPWFVNPYTGAEIKPWQLLANIRYENPDWMECAQGKSLQQLTEEIDPRLGERLVQVDQMFIDENTQPAVADWQSEQTAEQLNFDAVAQLGQLNPALRPSIRPIVHAPFYGLWCLRVRVCVPILNPAIHVIDDPNAGRLIPRYRFWCRFPYRLHQPICWSRTWWHRWYPAGHPCNPNRTVPWICPWRPWCLPFARWTREGPDWTFHVTSVNSWRHWCLYGFRYYFQQITPDPILQRIDVNQIQQVPRITDLNSLLEPGQLATPWLVPYPYPTYRYWPYRPYCTRWYWFRCLPWWRYRHFPPTVHFAVAVPNAANGAGFDPSPPEIPGDLLFPPGPPNFADGSTGADAGVQGASFDSFFDIDVECRGRANLVPIGDNDGDGRYNVLLDNPVGLKQLRGLPASQDTEVLGIPGN